MKILHCSDLHFGKRPSGKRAFSDLRYEDYFKAFQSLMEKIEEKELDVLLIAGDMFDKKEINSNILWRTEDLFRQLKEKKPRLRILVIDGNHDMIRQEEDSWLSYLERKGYFEVYFYQKDFEVLNSVRIGDVNFYPVGYPGFLVDEALTKLVKQLNPEEKNIVIVHTGISGSNSLPGLVGSNVLDLFQDKVIYMAGGHIHSFHSYPKEKPYFFVSGSLEFSNVPNERSDRKGAIYFDTDSLHYEFIEVEHRKRIRAPLFSYEGNMEKEFEEYMEGLTLTGEELLIIPIEQKGREYINVERLEQIAEAKGALKVYFEIKSMAFSTEIKTEEEKGVFQVEDLERSLIENWDFLGKPEQFAEKFSYLKELCKGEEEEEFLANVEKLLEEDEL